MCVQCLYVGLSHRSQKWGFKIGYDAEIIYNKFLKILYVAQIKLQY